MNSANSKNHEECSCEENKKEVSLESLDEETKRKIQELQILEQSLQQFLMQKQAFSMELEETSLCLEELKEAKGDVFKIISGKIMIKSKKEDMEKELMPKKDLIELRLKTMEKQEAEFLNKTECLRQEIIKKISG